MVDFFKHMSPEAKARYESRKRNFEKDVAEFKVMSAEQLVERVEYFMKNCEFPGRYQPGEPVYDGVIAHVIIPELLRRVKGDPKPIEITDGGHVIDHRIPPGSGRLIMSLNTMHELAFKTDYKTDLEKLLMSQLQDALVLITALRKGEVR